MRGGIRAGRLAGTLRDVPVRRGSQGVLELCQLRPARGASVPRSSRGSCRRKTCGELLRVFRNDPPRVCAERRRQLARKQSAGHVEEIVRRLNSFLREISPRAWIGRITKTKKPSRFS